MLGTMEAEGRGARARRPWNLGVGVAVVISAGLWGWAAAALAGADADAAYRAEIESWRQERVSGLEQPDGWLSLVGLFWLEPGSQGFGSAPDNRVRLPEGEVPPHLGRFEMDRDGRVTVQVEPGHEVLHDGQPVERMVLTADADGEPTVLAHGSLHFYVIRRGSRIGVRVKDTQSPLIASFHGLDYFPIDPAWRVEAGFEFYQPPRVLRIPTVLGTEAEDLSPGAAVFSVGGRAYRLIATADEDGLFFVFGDETNGRNTYGGGRFLHTGPPDERGKVVLDFNRAYNPPCAFTPYATCPLPPKENRLDLAVEAGEKVWSGHQTAAHAAADR
jgi:uncharacterized protein (DUF1684 family)